MIERYGWDKLKREGLKELERIASSKLFAGKDELVYILKKYIELYRNDADLKNQIQGTAFYPDIANRAEKPARDKASQQIKKLRQLLRDFNDSDEGKESEYRIRFISEERDYRLKVEKTDILGEINKETAAISAVANSSIIRTDTKLPEFAHIKEILLSFFKIYPEAWAMPKRLVARSTASGTFNWDTIGVFLFSTLLVVVTSRWYFSSFRSYIEMANIHPDTISFIVDRLVKIEKPIKNLLSFELIFAIFRFSILATVIPWIIYNKIFKGRATIYSIINFQFYFIMCWIPIAVWIGFASISLSFRNIDLTSLGMVVTFLGGYFLWRYYCCLYKLSGFTWKKAILPSIIYFYAYYWFIETL